MFSKSCKYGLRTIIYLNHHQKDDFISLNKIAKELNIPFHFLTKVMQKLNTAGLVESRRGPVGGIKLKENSDTISMLDIVNAIKDKEDLLDECFLGLPTCHSTKPCPYHNQWCSMVDKINDVLKNLHLNEFNCT